MTRGVIKLWKRDSGILSSAVDNKIGALLTDFVNMLRGKVSQERLQFMFGIVLKAFDSPITEQSVSFMSFAQVEF